MTSRILAAVVLVLAVTGRSEASPITFTDTYDPGDVLLDKSGGACIGLNGATDSVSGDVNGACDSLAWTHSLTGFNASTDTLSSASLSLWFRDDNDPSADKVNYVFDILVGDGTLTSQMLPSLFTFDVLSLVGDGQLAAALSTKAGDLVFERSVLTALGERTAANPADVTAVPEPASLTLFGLGLSGLAYRLRRRTSVER
jgi:hypothetical protein